MAVLSAARQVRELVLGLETFARPPSLLDTMRSSFRERLLFIDGLPT